MSKIKHLLYSERSDQSLIENNHFYTLLCRQPQGKTSVSKSELLYIHNVVGAVSAVPYIRLYGEKYKYKLLEDVSVELDPSSYGGKSFDHSYFSLSTQGVLTAKKGYCWDGCTGVPDVNFVESSLFHDVVSQAEQIGLINSHFIEVNDRVFFDLCLLYSSFKNNGPTLFDTICAIIYYWGLRLLGPVYRKFFRG